MVVNTTIGYGTMSFMDGSSEYDQIKMNEHDVMDTIFHTSKGNFYYTVMPFGLKNAGATSQWTMIVVLDILICNQWSATLMI
jgi:hypothetical protein